MNKITFYPLGNADCCLIELENGKLILFDYANMRSSEEDDLRIDLQEALKERLADLEKNYFDVVAITHADKDHIKGFSEFFYLEHAEKYQDEDRIQIKELWVPAAVILEKGASDEDRILRQEARHRLIEGERIRVFSNPEILADWLDKQDLTVEDREPLITHAGEIIPGFSKDEDGVDFFVHAPFSVTIGDDENFIRNDAALVVQGEFAVEDEVTRLLLGADIAHEGWQQIVKITKYYENMPRLAWDIFKIPHHCSYLSLNNEKGDDITEPIKEVEELFELGFEHGILISTSDPIPDEDTDQPPHRQAAKYYITVAEELDGEFVVTMEHPRNSAPAPLVIEISTNKAKIIKRSGTVYTTLRSRSTPRAG
ncbi:MAG: hypothetical protein H8D34_09340 [Chloroflexi bacterium]|nr:hypothetical protein [Chloroflexota bacterium]